MANDKPDTLALFLAEERKLAAETAPAPCCNFHATGGTQQYPCGTDDGEEGDRALGEVKPREVRR